MNNYSEMPYSMRLSFQLLMIFLIGYFIYIGHGVLVPIYFAVLLSILLLPLSNFLERYLPKAMANLVTVIFAFILIAGIIYFLSSQISGFLKDSTAIRDHLTQHYYTIQNWVEAKFHISQEQQDVMISNAKANVEKSGGIFIGQTFLTVTEAIFIVVLVTIYAFLILYYRAIIQRFLFQVFKRQDKEKVQEVMSESKHIIQKYMVGLLIEMMVVAVLNSIVLFLIGIKYAIFLGLFAALLNIVPYIGIFSGMIFTVLVTLSTSASMNKIVWIIVGMEVIHFMDANFLMPRIVGSKVKINALVTIIGVVIGGSLIGLPGIFLALPTIAILKIIFERIDSLKPWGLLFSDDPDSLRRKMAVKVKNKTIQKPV